MTSLNRNAPDFKENLCLPMPSESLGPGVPNPCFVGSTGAGDLRLPNPGPARV